MILKCTGRSLAKGRAAWPFQAQNEHNKMVELLDGALSKVLLLVLLLVVVLLLLLTLSLQAGHRHHYRRGQGFGRPG